MGGPSSAVGDVYFIKHLAGAGNAVGSFSRVWGIYITWSPKAQGPRAKRRWRGGKSQTLLEKTGRAVSPRHDLKAGSTRALTAAVFA